MIAVFPFVPGQGFSQVWIYHWVPVLLWFSVGFLSSFMTQPGKLAFL